MAKLFTKQHNGSTMNTWKLFSIKQRMDNGCLGDFSDLFFLFHLFTMSRWKFLLKKMLEKGFGFQHRQKNGRQYGSEQAKANEYLCGNVIIS